MISCSNWGMFECPHNGYYWQKLELGEFVSWQSFCRECHEPAGEWTKLSDPVLSGQVAPLPSGITWID